MVNVGRYLGQTKQKGSNMMKKATLPHPQPNAVPIPIALINVNNKKSTVLLDPAQVKSSLNLRPAPGKSIYKIDD